MPEALGNKLDLKLMYPQRTRSHVSEAAALWGLVGEWCIRKKDLEGAKNYLEMLERFAQGNR